MLILQSQGISNSTEKKQISISFLSPSHLSFLPSPAFPSFCCSLSPFTPPSSCLAPISPHTPNLTSYSLPSLPGNQVWLPYNSLCLPHTQNSHSRMDSEHFQRHLCGPHCWGGWGLRCRPCDICRDGTSWGGGLVEGS